VHFCFVVFVFRLQISLRFIAQSQTVNKKSLPLASFAENSIF
ncbi:unnamed protein product, partial [Brassica napus]